MPIPVIPEQELEESFIRSGGPGGQNVNKVASAVQLRFDIPRSAVLDAPTKARLRQLGGRRVSIDGVLIITARAHRDQERNRAEARERLAELVREAATPPKIRKKTRPTKASKLRRLAGKQHRAQQKKQRKRGWDE